MSKVLLGDQVGAHVHRLFERAKPSARRVVITAYVGSDPVALLGSVSGVDVYCSPSPTGTSAEGICRLRNAGARVFFSAGLHMKVYWVEGLGGFVGSPNLSANGLSGGLAEALVEVPESAISIEEILSSFISPPVLATEELIAKLQKENDVARRRGQYVRENAVFGPAETVSPVDFPAWYARKASYPIKLGWYSDFAEPPERVEEAARNQGFTDGIEDFSAAFHASTYGVHDWILTFRVQEDVTRTAERVDWIWVDGVTHLTKKEAADDGLDVFRYVAWQAGKIRQVPPFSLQDRQIRGALRGAWREYAPSWKKAGELIDEEKLMSPPAGFFESVLRRLTQK